MSEAYDPKIVLILTVGFTLASILGYLSQYIKLSPILGYLLAGYVIGPFSPGYVADLKISEQLAEIGVILMMFGVGLHFKWQDLLKVKNIAIPGAIGQTVGATVVTAFLIHSIGWSWGAGIILGLAIGVASTVVLVRMLSDQDLLETPQGHIAVGWLIVEDILTVAALIMLPIIVAFLQGAQISFQEIATSIFLILVKFFLLAAIMFTLGRKVVVYILFNIARTRSQELFTLTVLALILLIATGSAYVFGTSIALGAFIAGMVVGQTDVRHQASAYASPLKDAFVVIFFLSVGMLFNPMAIIEHFPLFISVLTVILIVKPLIALLIVLLLRYPFKTGLTIAIALAQIGEFSFILAEEANKFKVLPDEGYDIIVACALISIAINPLLFKTIDYIKHYIEKKLPSSQLKGLKESSHVSLNALVIGYGPIGQSAAHILEKMGFIVVVIDRNVDTIAKLLEKDHKAIYGDASLPDILKTAQIESVNLLVITTPDMPITLNIIQVARQLHPNVTILARTRYSGDQHFLHELGVDFICCDEETVSKAFNSALFRLAERLFSA